MNRAILLACAVGIGLVTWRGIKANHKPVPPGQYLAAPGLYVLLALLAAYEPAEHVAVLLAWGFDLAIIFQVLPGQVSGPPAPPRQRPHPILRAGRANEWAHRTIGRCCGSRFALRP